MGNRIFRRETRQLSCRLTDAELIERGQALAEANENIGSEESQQESLKREMKARLAGFEATRARMSVVVSRRAELREVVCEEQMDDERGTVSVVRMDTGEVVHERPMRDDERQESLDLAPAAVSG